MHHFLIPDLGIFRSNVVNFDWNSFSVWMQVNPDRPGDMTEPMCYQLLLVHVRLDKYALTLKGPCRRRVAIFCAGQDWE